MRSTRALVVPTALIVGVSLVPSLGLAAAYARPAAAPDPGRNTTHADTPGRAVTTTGAGFHGPDLPLNAWRTKSGQTLLIDTTHEKDGRGRIITYDGSGGTELTFTGKLPRNLNVVATKGSKFTKKDNKYGAIDAHWGAEKVYEFYKALGRDSIDGKGGEIISVVGVGSEQGPMANAFWNGRYMVFGSGNKTYKPFSASLDVIGHEMTHGVIDTSVHMLGHGQPGALHEGIADYFGNAIEVDVTGWDPASLRGGVMGGDLCYRKPIAKCAIRDLNKSVNINANFLSGSADSGRVHDNSVLISSALWDIRKSLGSKVADPLIYAVVTNRLQPRSLFLDFRNEVVAEAAARGLTAAQQQIVAAAFDSRGIKEGWEASALHLDYTPLKTTLGGDSDLPAVNGNAVVFTDNPGGVNTPPAVYLTSLQGGTPTMLSPIDPKKKLGYARPAINSRQVVWVRATESGNRAAVQAYDRATHAITTIATVPKNTSVNQLVSNDQLTAWTEVGNKFRLHLLAADGATQTISLPKTGDLRQVALAGDKVVITLGVPRSKGVGGELRIVRYSIDGKSKVLDKISQSYYPATNSMAGSSKYVVVAADFKQGRRTALVRYDVNTGARKVLIPESTGPMDAEVAMNDEWITWSNADRKDDVLRQMTVDGVGADRMSCAPGESWGPVAAAGRGVLWIANATTNDDLVYRAGPAPACTVTREPVSAASDSGTWVAED